MQSDDELIFTDMAEKHNAENPDLPSVTPLACKEQFDLLNEMLTLKNKIDVIRHRDYHPEEFTERQHTLVDMAERCRLIHQKLNVHDWEYNPTFDGTQRPIPGESVEAFVARHRQPNKKYSRTQLTDIAKMVDARYPGLTDYNLGLLLPARPGAVVSYETSRAQGRRLRGKKR